MKTTTTNRLTRAGAALLTLTGLVGACFHTDHHWRVGVALTLVGLTLFIIDAVKRHTASAEVTADQLAEAEHAGYCRALDHVARGLLDAPTTPLPGCHCECHGGIEPSADNVITLPTQPTQHTAPLLERKAQ